MNPSVLIVDDEEFICSALQRTFKKEKFDVIAANSGKEALQIIENNSVDIIISDQKMPGMTGTQLLTTVKNTHPEIPRIILSGHSDANDLTEAINEASINKFLTKPWDDNDLINVVRTTLESEDKAEEKIEEKIGEKVAAEVIEKQTTPIIQAATPIKTTVIKRKQSYDQANLKRDIKSDLMLLNKVTFQRASNTDLALNMYQALWSPFSNFNHDGLVNMASQSSCLSDLFLWYLINTNADLNSPSENNKGRHVIDLFFGPAAHQGLTKQLMLKLLRSKSHLIFRVNCDTFTKPGLHTLLPEIYRNHHSILLNLEKNTIDIRELIKYPVHHIEMDSKPSSLNDSRLTQKRINMLNDAQNMGIKTILSIPQSKNQQDYAVNMGFDYF